MQADKIKRLKAIGANLAAAGTSEAVAKYAGQIAEEMASESDSPSEIDPRDLDRDELEVVASELDVEFSEDTSDEDLLAAVLATQSGE